MSFENNVITSVNDTYFKIKNLNFVVIEDTKINTDLFLNASKQVVELIEQMGKIFAPVQYDMNNNVNKIYSVYEKDVNKNKYLDELLLYEKEINDNLGIISVLWLKRALHLFQRFFEFIVESYTNDRIPPTVNSFLEEAYNEVLRPYHGWFTQKLFCMVCMKEITSKQIFEILSCNTNINEDIIISDMKIFTENLKECITNISNIYTEHNLENEERH